MPLKSLKHAFQGRSYLENLNFTGFLSLWMRNILVTSSLRKLHICKRLWAIRLHITELTEQLANGQGKTFQSQILTVSHVYIQYRQPRLIFQKRLENNNACLKKGLPFILSKRQIKILPILIKGGILSSNYRQIHVMYIPHSCYMR